MPKRTHNQLSRRERQIMEVIYAAGKATVTEVLDALPDPPSYSAVRALLRILETKGHLRHVIEGTRYVFLPTLSPDRARRSAMRSMIQTFFQGSPEKAVAALLEVSRSGISEEELARISRMIDKAREEGR
ncbi:MAG TPA: BlaI/MecI/CopY family transcriptional regulator [Thermoanaerobaculia bacterium]